MGAILTDLTKCIGCRSCQVACKAWNDLPADATKGRGSYENPTKLSAQTWTRITFTETETSDGLAWTFAKRNCMHCLMPACEAACMVGALKRTDDGPVLYDADKCVGCRYCMLACPFRVPRFQWLEPIPYIQKCTMCAERLAVGLSPACVTACPTGALVFGDRLELLDEAYKRQNEHPGRYVDRVYGDEEAGGTGMLYLSPVAFEDLGFPEVGVETISRFSEKAMSSVPAALAGVAAAMGGLYWFISRRERLKQEKENQTNDDKDRTNEDQPEEDDA